MLDAAHRLLVCLYLVLPVAALVAAMLRDGRARRGRTGRVRRVALRALVMTALAGTLVGLAYCIVYAMLSGGRAGPGQVALAAYFATGLFLLLRGLDRTLAVALAALWGVRADTTGWRPRAALLARAAIMFGVALPYMIVALLTYRPRLDPAAAPAAADPAATSVSFQTSDGFQIAGTWMPAAAGDGDADGRARASSSSSPSARRGRETVIVCHGLTARYGEPPTIVKALRAAGYNVLSFDFRAFGDSDGQVTSFGDLERRDVHAAVKWARAAHPAACRRLLGVGSATGGAALLAAAADDSAEGAAIDAVVVVGTYDRFDAWAASIARQYFVPPLGWLTTHVGLPLAAVQTGADLARFAPADAARRFAPRPLMVLHARRDRLVDVGLGVSLFDAASAPKSALWLEEGQADDLTANPSVVTSIVRFLDDARPML